MGRERKGWRERETGWEKDRNRNRSEKERERERERETWWERERDIGGRKRE